MVLLVPMAAAKPVGQDKHTLTKEEIRECEQRLSDLGYWTGPVDGVMDSAFHHALIAFQKVERRKRTGLLTNDELIALRSAERPTSRAAGPAHIEVDLTRQVLFYVDETGQVEKILPVSTGNGRAYDENGEKGIAHTPSGTFQVFRKVRGWRKSALGLLYYPAYFTGGFAIHGSPSVPAFPASHGCVRIPMYAAAEFSKLAAIGMVVMVYNNVPD